MFWSHALDFKVICYWRYCISGWVGSREGVNFLILILYLRRSEVSCFLHLQIIHSFIENLWLFRMCQALCWVCPGRRKLPTFWKSHPCLYCSRPHYIKRCDVFKILNQRLAYSKCSIKKELLILYDILYSYFSSAEEQSLKFLYLPA